MQSELTLTITDELGLSRQLAVQQKRLTIGRTPENDLPLENSRLSRRHAVLENFDGVVQVTDCGSQNGTEVNGHPVVGSTILSDGDVITLGGVIEIEVAIVDASKVSHNLPHGIHANGSFAPSLNDGSVSGSSSVSLKGGSVAQRSQLNSSITYVVAAVAGVLVIVVAVVLLIWVLSQSRTSQLSNRNTVTRTAESPQATPTSDSADNSNTSTGEDESGNTSTGDSLSEQQIEKAAAAVVRHISSDDKTYAFSDKALHDITRKLSQYRSSSTLPGNLAAIERNSASLATLSRREGLEPGLLLYLLLVQAEAGRQSVDSKSAEGVAADLLALRATFGTNDADSSLLIVAAYKVGRGEKRSHPLLVTIRRLVKNPLTQRNVWYLNEHGGLEPEVYDFVVSFLALGAIAQDPAQFGVAAGPLVF